MLKLVVGFLMLAALAVPGRSAEGLDFVFSGCNYVDGAFQCSMRFVNGGDEDHSELAAVWGEFGEVLSWRVDGGCVTVVSGDREWEWTWRLSLPPGASAEAELGIAPPEAYPDAVLYRWTKGDETSAGTFFIREPVLRWFPFWGGG